VRANGDVEIHGVDTSQTMIRTAREKSGGVAGRLAFHLADAAALTGFPPAHFDVAVCNMALMDIKDYRGAIAEVARTLKQGWKFVFSLPHPCFFTPQTYSFHPPLEDYAGELADHGFAITALREPGPPEELLAADASLARELRRAGFLLVRSMRLRYGDTTAW
jgi:SAM-dependent methyltransferase